VASVAGWAGGPVPAEFAVRGLHGATLLESATEPTSGLLTGILGFTPSDSQETMHRFESPGDGPGRVMNVRAVGGFWSGKIGVGAIHHIAFRAPDDEAQLRIRSTLIEQGFPVTPVIDRRYFHSIYFHEPGGVLLEIATDGPGFTVDEPLEQLGTQLKLPPWMESEYEAIRSQLTPLELPGVRGPAGG
jgi:glyoxalase family protein